ncbi:MAG: DUF4956 domain-containing protein [Clostridia bacterium]|nr:DUF4956 domain-containing protein [Clostridia bacterium]
MMFDSIYSSSVTTAEFFLMAGVAVLSGALYAWIMSRRVRATRRFFIVVALIPFVVGAMITFVNGNIGAGVAIGGAFGLIRFRSAQGTADEIAAIFIAMGAGIAFGMGYLAYGVIILLALGLLFFLFSALHFFESKRTAEERLLKVTVPESLEYTDMFDEVFARYLLNAERIGVKTTGMGSMFRLSFLIRMKDPKEEKAFIDELRTRNGNLEIAMLPYTEQQAQL